MKRLPRVFIIWFLLAGFIPLMMALVYAFYGLAVLFDCRAIMSIVMFMILVIIWLVALWSFIPHFLFPQYFVWGREFQHTEYGPRGWEGWVFNIVFYTVIVLVLWFILRLIRRRN